MVTTTREEEELSPLPPLPLPLPPLLLLLLPLPLLLPPLLLGRPAPGWDPSGHVPSGHAPSGHVSAGHAPAGWRRMSCDATFGSSARRAASRAVRRTVSAPELLCSWRRLSLSSERVNFTVATYAKPGDAGGSEGAGGDGVGGK